MKRLLPLVFLISCVSLMLTPLAHAQSVSWGQSGTKLSTVGSYQPLNCDWGYWDSYYTSNFNTNVTDDGSGGMIVSWQDYSTDYYIRVQRVSSAGVVLWNATGNIVYNYNYTWMQMSSVVSDGRGGAYIAYTAYNPNVGDYAPYVQYVDPSGNMKWGTYGKQLGSVSTTEYAYGSYPFFITIDNDGNGGFVAQYYVYPSSTSAIYGNMYAARMIQTNTTDAAPTFVWGPVNVFTHNSTEYCYYAYSGSNESYYAQPNCCCDGNGGMILAWQTYNSGYKMRVARLNNTGQIVYNTNVSIPYYIYNGGYGNGPYVYQPMPLKVMNDASGGAIIVYGCYYSTYYYSPVFAFRLAWSGTSTPGSGSTSVPWGPTIHSRYYYYNYGAHVSPDNNGGFYLADWDEYSSGQLYLRHFDVNNNMQFDNNIGSMGYGCFNLANDGAGDAMLAWNTSSGYVIDVQKYNTSGTSMWGSSPLVVSNSAYQDYYGWPEIASDGAAGALVAWDYYSDNIVNCAAYGNRIADTSAGAHGSVNVTAVSTGNVRVSYPAPNQYFSATNSSLIVKNYPGSAPLVQAKLQVTGWTSKYGTAKVTSPAFPFTLALNGTQAIGIQQRALLDGPNVDTIFLNTNDGVRGAPFSIAVTSTGIYPHEKSNDTMNMPPTVRSVPYNRTYTINNTGTDVLNITSATLTNNDYKNYSFPGAAPATPQSITFSPAVQIAAGGQGTINVTFTPQTADPKLATMSVFSDDSSSPKVVQIAGTGVFPHITTTSTQLNFPYTVQDARTSTLAYTITNTGTSPLVITGAPINNAEFTVSNLPTVAAPITINPGKSGSLQVVFAPLSINCPVPPCTRNALMNIITNYDSLNPYPVTITGIGVDGAPDMSYSTFIDCGSIHVSKFDTIPYVIANLSDATKKLVISSITLNGANAADFKILNLPSMPDTLAIGAAQTLYIRFAAADSGLLVGNMHVISNDAPFPIDVPMQGVGTKAAIYLTALDFGKVAINKDKDTTLKVSNFGTDVLNISSCDFIDLPGHNSIGNFFFLSTGNLVLAPNQTSTISIRYHPKQPGTDTILVRFITSDLSTPDTSYVMVTGRGVNDGNLFASNLNFHIEQINQSVTKLLHITNTGDLPVNITGVTYQNATAPNPFSSDIMTPVSVASGSAIDVNVTFSSTTGGDKSADMVFSTDDQFGLTVHLVGSATIDSFATTPGLLFDNVTIVVNSQIQDNIYITNFQKIAAQISSLDIVGRDANAYRILYPITWPYSIPGLGDDSVMVGFYPTSPMSYTYLATLEIWRTNDSTPIRIGLTGRSTPSDVRTSAPLPSDFGLSQNYPNPFSASTQFSYAIPERAQVSLKVYDVMGRMVRELVNGSRDAGVYTIELASEGLPDGLYTYALNVNGVTRSHLMHIVK